jgi:hypothetical protein
MKTFVHAATLLLVCLCFAPACKKKKSVATEEEPQPAAVVYDNYTQLKTGNYWIYGRYHVDTDGSVTNLHSYDSCYVEKDTIANGKTYFKYCSYNFINDRKEVSYQRDSLGYTVALDGSVLFSSTDFTTVFKSYYTTFQVDSLPTDTICRIISKMDDKDKTITVPAGTFVSSSYKMTYAFYPKWIIAGRSKRYMDTRYAKNVGLIAQTEPFFLNSTYTVEKRLLRYHLN